MYRTGSRFRTDKVQHAIQKVQTFYQGQGHYGLCLLCHSLQHKEIMCTLEEKSNQNGFYDNNTHKSPFSNEMENRLEGFG